MMRDSFKIRQEAKRTVHTESSYSPGNRKFYEKWFSKDSIDKMEKEYYENKAKAHDEKVAMLKQQYPELYEQF